MSLKIDVRSITITPARNPVAVVEATVTITAYKEQWLNNVLKEFYGRGLHCGAPRLHLQVSGQKIFLNVRANAPTMPTEEEIRALLKYLEIGQAMPEPKPTKSQPPIFRRQRPQFA